MEYYNFLNSNRLEVEAESNMEEPNMSDLELDMDEELRVVFDKWIVNISTQILCILNIISTLHVYEQQYIIIAVQPRLMKGWYNINTLSEQPMDE